MLKKCIQQRQIRSKPVRSPSPDYLSANRNVRTMAEVNETNLILNSKFCPPPSAFPKLPSEMVNKKKRASEEENVNPSFMSPVSKSNNNKTNPSSNKPVSSQKQTVQIPEV